jgi:hypothetical protein
MTTVPPDGRTVGWTIEEHLVFDVGYALPRSAVRGLRRAFTEDERRRIAKAIVAHLQLCGWRFELSAPEPGHGRRD